MLILAPLLIGALLSYFFRSKHEDSKGVIHVRTNCGMDWYRARSTEWAQELHTANSGFQCKPGEH